MNYDYITFEMI